MGKGFPLVRLELANGGGGKKKKKLRKGGRANGSFDDPQLDHGEHYHRIYSVNVGDKNDKYRKASLRREPAQPSPAQPHDAI